MPRLLRTLLLLTPLVSAPQLRAQQSTEESTVRAFVAAFNKHDVAAMLALADSNITWLYITGDSTTVETRGKAQLSTSMTSYFKSIPTSQSAIETLSALGPWVTVRERASWTSTTGPKSQASMSVYEVQNGKVRRVWYYPVVK